MQPNWKVMFTGVSVPEVFTSLPLASNNLTCGRRPLVWPARCFGSITTRDDKPVTSSICLATVTPSSTFSKRTNPAYSVIIGRVCGSHVANAWPALTCLPSCTCKVAPYGTLWCSRSRPFSSWIATSPLREITTCSPRALVT